MSGNSSVCSSETGFREDVVLAIILTKDQIEKTSAELFPSQEINEEIDGGVQCWQYIIGENFEDHAPNRRATFTYLFIIKNLINVEGNSGHVTQDEDGHNQEQNGWVGHLLAAALAGVNCNKNSNIEKYE